MLLPRGSRINSIAWCWVVVRVVYIRYHVSSQVYVVCCRNSRPRDLTGGRLYCNAQLP